MTQEVSRPFRVQIVARGSTSYELTVNSSTALNAPYWESSDGAMAWNSVWMHNDGRIVEVGNGNHVAANSNSIRWHDPLGKTNGYYWDASFPSFNGWGSSWPDSVLPSYGSTYGTTYWWSHDNLTQFYIPWKNWYLFQQLMLFDFNTGTFLSGNRHPAIPDRVWQGPAILDTNDLILSLPPEGGSAYVCICVARERDRESDARYLARPEKAGDDVREEQSLQPLLLRHRGQPELQDRATPDVDKQTAEGA